MPKHMVHIMTDAQYRDFMNGKLDPKELMSVNSFKCNNFNELEENLNRIARGYFISQLKILKVLDKNGYDKLREMNMNSRTGYNDKVVTKVGDYRFQDMCCWVDNTIEYRYFILDFTGTIKVEDEEYAKNIYEIDILSFNLLVAEICSAKQDIEDKLDVEDAEKYLLHMASVIKEFINKYYEIKKLEEALKEK